MTETFPDAGKVGKKFDTGKPMVRLLDGGWLLGQAQVMTMGAKKYGVDNWKNFSPQDTPRFVDACFRHLIAYNDGERFDAESGLSHLYHLGCEAMFADHMDRRQDKINQLAQQIKPVDSRLSPASS